MIRTPSCAEKWPTPRPPTPAALRYARRWSRMLKNERSRDVELTEEELAAEDEEYTYWLVDKGWANDESCFREDSCKGID